MKQKMTVLKSGLFVALLAGAGLASDAVKPVEASADSATFDYLSKQVNSFMAKAGISFGGEFRSRALSSSMGGNLINADKSAKKVREDVLFTSLDLAMKVGPHSAFQGTAVVRLHEDWRNMFASFSSPLSTRWISIDGNVNDIFFYSAGDFKDKFTELTLWAPEPEIMFEPYIFARQRQQVMNEVFAGNNNRVLQGVNAAFMAKISPVFEELTAKAYFTRTRTEGKEAGIGVPTDTDSRGVEMDRYSYGEQVFARFRKDAEFGLASVVTQDALNSHPMGNEAGKATWDQTLVVSAKGAFGTGLFPAIDANVINVRLDGEFAMSMHSVYDSVMNSGTLYGYNKKSVNGIAFNANLGTTVGLSDAGKIKLDLGYIFNDDKFTNEMAQSPIFFNRQILNTAVATDSSGNGIVSGSAYNSFDGLYKSVYKYTPGQGEMSTKEPMAKIAWTRGVLTKEELDAIVIDQSNPTNESVKLDRTFSPVMHFGQATANRAGVQTGISGEFLDKAILLSGEFNFLQTPKLDSSIAGSHNKFDYMQFGAGASLNVAKFGDWWAYPFILSGSFRHTDTKAKAETVAYAENATVDFGNVGLYWKFWKRAALLGGAQVVMSKETQKVDGKAVAKSGIIEGNYAGGIEYKVTDGGTLTGTVGKIVSSNPTGDNTDEYAPNRNFDTWQFDLFLTVVF